MTPAEAHQKLLSLCERGAFTEALPLAEALVTALPDQPVLWFLLGCIHSELNELNASANAFRQALRLNSKDVSAHFNLGCVLQRLGKNVAALEAFRKATALDPHHAQAHNNIGTSLRKIGDMPQAIAALRKAVESDPTFIAAKINLVDALRETGVYQDAQSLLGDVLSSQPNNATALALMLQIKGACCDFSRTADFESVQDVLGISTVAASPFAMLQLEDDPYRQRRRAEIFARHTYPKSAPSLKARTKSKLRIGYFSANFHDHPCMFLAADLFRHHDRSQFEVFGYSLGTPKPSDIRDKIIPHLTAFHDVNTQSDADIAALAREHEIDVAIDIEGYTKNARLGIYAHRAAPCQISYLGYPGTLALPFIDYIVADNTVIPPEQRSHYAEHVMFMPDTYAPMDNARRDTTSSTTRSDHDLPAGAVVLCCFNNPAKIDGHVFGIWMRIMQQISQSVLWLLDANPLMRANLIREATLHGVDESRVIFAPYLSQEHHLERYRHADLIVDTFIYNAHTTANDALWAGVPVVTKTGKQFASRVATSLLKAAGLPELSTSSDAAYEALILSLAGDPKQLARLKTKLRQNRSTAPLFDSSHYARHFEAGLLEIHRCHEAGLTPEDILTKDLINLAN